MNLSSAKTYAYFYFIRVAIISRHADITLLPSYAITRNDEMYTSGSLPLKTLKCRVTSRVAAHNASITAEISFSKNDFYDIISPLKFKQSV